MSEIEAPVPTDSLYMKKIVISAFLGKCNEYAQKHLSEVTAKLGSDDLSTKESMALYEDLSKWSSYIHFNHVAIRELQTNKLDHWLEGPTNSSG